MLGLSVLDISTVKNACDLVVSNGDRTILFEVKDPAKMKKTRVDMLTEGELKFRESWRGEYYIVFSTTEIVQIFNREFTE